MLPFAFVYAAADYHSEFVSRCVDDSWSTPVLRHALSFVRKHVSHTSRNNTLGSGSGRGARGTQGQGRYIAVHMRRGFTNAQTRSLEDIVESIQRILARASGHWGGRGGAKPTTVFVASNQPEVCMRADVVRHAALAS